MESYKVKLKVGAKMTFSLFLVFSKLRLTQCLSIGKKQSTNVMIVFLGFVLGAQFSIISGHRLQLFMDILHRQTNSECHQKQ